MVYDRKDKLKKLYLKIYKRIYRNRFYIIDKDLNLHFEFIWILRNFKFLNKTGFFFFHQKPYLFYAIND